MAVFQILPVVLGEQRVQKRVDAAVAVGQTRHQVVNTRAYVRSKDQGLVVEGQKLPYPKGQEAGPEHEHDREDHYKHFLLR